MNRTLAVAILTLSVIAPIGTAHATTFADGTTGNDLLVVGVYTDGKVRWCRDAPGSGSDTYQIISTNGTLTDNVEIRGRAGNDDIFIIRVGTNISGYCQGLWSAPTYGGYFIDAIGEDGADGIRSGSGDSQVRGNGGNDDIWHYNSIGEAFGDDGDDDMAGRGGSAEYLHGGNGSDCLEDDTHTFAWLDGGPHGSSLDYWRWGNCMTCPTPPCPPICDPANGISCFYPLGCANTESIWGGVGGGTCF